MGTVHVLGDTYPATAVIAKAMEDLIVEGYDQVLVVMGGPQHTEIRWSTMRNADLAFLIASAQAELYKRLSDG